MSSPKVDLFKTDTQLRVFHILVGLVMVLTVLTSPSLGLRFFANRTLHKLLYILVGALGLGALVYHSSVLLKKE